MITAATPASSVIQTTASKSLFRIETSRRFLLGSLRDPFGTSVTAITFRTQ